MSARLGGGAAANRARRVFASAERKEALDRELELRSAREVAATLGSMKGAMMKLGQLASFVDSGVPEAFRQALTDLQADAPPMSSELSASVVASELGQPPDEVFAQWDPVPIAAASIGQVHRAITHDGRAVAVKVQYPGIDHAIAADLDNIDLAGLIAPILCKGLDAKAVAAELRARLTEELDYALEARRQQRFADFYRGHPT
ncbi:MAG: ABC1 kinase family protein, partial [Acidimicrobiales bacterium]